MSFYDDKKNNEMKYGTSTVWWFVNGLIVKLIRIFPKSSWKPCLLMSGSVSSWCLKNEIKKMSKYEISLPYHES